MWLKLKLVGLILIAIRFSQGYGKYVRGKRENHAQFA